MPNNSSPLKIAATAGYGASITFSGPTSPEREAALNQILTTTGARFIPPYNHPHIILGAGTAALELRTSIQFQKSKLPLLLSSRTPQAKQESAI